MKLEYIEDIIEVENIQLIDTYLEDTEGAYVHYDTLDLILYDNKQIKNSKRKKEVLAEEYGHFFGDYTYKFNSPLQLISKQEYRARKWAYDALIPYPELTKAISSGCISCYSLADYFDLTPEYITNAINFYGSKYGNFTKEYYYEII